LPEKLLHMLSEGAASSSETPTRAHQHELLPKGKGLQKGPGGQTAGWLFLLLILLFMWFTSPIATHALSRAALLDPEDPPPLLHEEPPPSKS
jgi:hypothetical protein